MWNPLAPGTMVQYAVNPTTHTHKHTWGHPQNTNTFPLTIFTFSKTTGSIFFSGAGSLPLFHLSSFSFYNDFTNKTKNTGPMVTNSLINYHSKCPTRIQKIPIESDAIVWQAWWFLGVGMRAGMHKSWPQCSKRHPSNT